MISLGKKATNHHLISMLSTTKNVLFPGPANHRCLWPDILIITQSFLPSVRGNCHEIVLYINIDDLILKRTLKNTLLTEHCATCVSPKTQLKCSLSICSYSIYVRIIHRFVFLSGASCTLIEIVLIILPVFIDTQQIFNKPSHVHIFVTKWFALFICGVNKTKTVHWAKRPLSTR